MLIIGSCKGHHSDCYDRYHHPLAICFFGEVRAEHIDRRCSCDDRDDSEGGCSRNREFTPTSDVAVASLRSYAYVKSSSAAVAVVPSSSSTAVVASSSSAVRSSSSTKVATAPSVAPLTSTATIRTITQTPSAVISSAAPSSSFDANAAAAASGNSTSEG